jgi:colanic acid biosynthesis glycosyl transferase WcaI
MLVIWGAKQGLEMVFEAAAQYQSQSGSELHSKSLAAVKFVFVGAGAHVDTLKQQAVDMNFKNVIFKPLQAWEDVPAMLAMADVHLVVQKKGAADVVLPSKLTNKGAEALIGARTSVFSDMPAGLICIGSPAKPVKLRNSPVLKND